MLASDQLLLHVVSQSILKGTVEGVHFQDPDTLLDAEAVLQHVHGEPFYWQLPKQFERDQLLAYGGKLRYSVAFYSTHGSGTSNYEPQVLIKGGRARKHVIYMDAPAPENGVRQAYDVGMKEDHLDPIWVPERLVRKVQVQTEAEKDPVPVSHPFNGESDGGVAVGILSAFPKPMPVRHDAQVFPRLFTTNKKLNLPFIPLDTEIAPIGENRSLSEEGNLCVTVNVYANSSCITLSRFSTGWFYGYRKYGAQSYSCNSSIAQENITTSYSVNVVWFNGTWPWYQHVGNFSIPPPQPKWAPTCWGTYEGESWP